MITNVLKEMSDDTFMRCLSQETHHIKELLLLNETEKDDLSQQLLFLYLENLFYNLNSFNLSPIFKISS